MTDSSGTNRSGADRDDGGTGIEEELPRDVVDEAERLTRLAREAVDDAEAKAYRRRRGGLLAEHGFTARVREDDAGETLVVHPAEWVEDGTVRTDRIEDLDRAVEMSLSGPGAPEEWAAVDEHNRAIVADVADAHGPDHAANAEAFADFMGNHYAKPVESATAGEVREFLEEYYPRNVWPSDDQRTIVEASIRLVFETAGERVPEF